MTKLREIYYCKHCKNLVEVLQVGAGTLECCGEAMLLLEANSTDAANEKHVPAIVDHGDSIEVTVGSVVHPMTEEHYITFIECLTTKGVCRKELKPGDPPVANFKIKKDELLSVREFCNLHMLWKKE